MYNIFVLRSLKRKSIRKPTSNTQSNGAVLGGRVEEIDPAFVNTSVFFCCIVNSQTSSSYSIGDERISFYQITDYHVNTFFVFHTSNVVTVFKEKKKRKM